jgi:hypothetical protein
LLALPALATTTAERALADFATRAVGAAFTAEMRETWAIAIVLDER